MDEPLPLHLRAPRWRLWYRQRMVRGLETCRRCGIQRKHSTVDSEGLRLGHILARALGGANGPDNITITCLKCEVEIGASDQTGILKPLCEEPSFLECANAWNEDQQDVYLEAMYEKRRENSKTKRRKARRRRARARMTASVGSAPLPLTTATAPVTADVPAPRSDGYNWSAGHRRRSQWTSTPQGEWLADSTMNDATGDDAMRRQSTA